MRRAIRVKPGASRTRVGGRHDPDGADALVVQVQAPAVDGKSNQAVLAALEIVAGHTSRSKLVELDDELAEAWQSLLKG